MTRHERNINTLIIMREASGDPRQKQALDDAIRLMRDASGYIDRAYMQGMRDGRIKEKSQ